MPILLMIISVIQSDGLCLPYYQRHSCTYLPTATTLKEQPPLYHTTRHNHTNLSTPTTLQYQTPLYHTTGHMYLLAYRNHLTITSTCLPYYQIHNCTYLPTAITSQQHPPVYHTTRDTTVFTCLQQPPYNNIHLSTILPETRLYLLAYSNHLTITSTRLPYFKYTYLPAETTLQ